jgi:hypothetical protein
MHGATIKKITVILYGGNLKMGPLPQENRNSMCHLMTMSAATIIQRWLQASNVK